MLALRPFEKAAEARSAINHGFFSPLQGVGVGSDQVGIGDERCSIERPSAMQISCDAWPRYPILFHWGLVAQSFAAIMKKGCAMRADISRN